MKHVLAIIEKATNQVVEEIDVAGETDRGVQQIRTAVQTQMNIAEYRIEERRGD